MPSESLKPQLQATELRQRADSLRQTLKSETYTDHQVALLEDWLQVADAFLIDGALTEAQIALNCVEESSRQRTPPT